MAKRRNKNKKAGPVTVIRPAAPEVPASEVEVQVAAPMPETDAPDPVTEQTLAVPPVAEGAASEEVVAAAQPVAEVAGDPVVEAPAADAADPTPTHAEVSVAEAMLATAASQMSSERADLAAVPPGIEIPGFAVTDAESDIEPAPAPESHDGVAPSQPLPEFDDASALLAQAAPADAGVDAARRSIESIAIPGASAEASEVGASAAEETDSATAQPARKSDRTLKLNKLKKHVRSVGEPEPEPEPEAAVEEVRKGPSEPRIAAFAQLAQYQSLSLAHVPGLPEEADVPGHWRGVGFGIGGRRFVAGFDEVVEIIRMPQVTHVPGTQPWMLGVANVRGTLLPVVDLKQFLAGERTVVYEGQRVMVVRQGGGNVAVLIDQLFGQRTFNDSHKVAAVASGATRYDHFIKLVYRVGDYDWGVFSMAMLTRTPEFRQAAA